MIQIKIGTGINPFESPGIAFYRLEMYPLVLSLNREALVWHHAALNAMRNLPRHSPPRSLWYSVQEPLRWYETDGNLIMSPQENAGVANVNIRHPGARARVQIDGDAGVYIQKS